MRKRIELISGLATIICAVLLISSPIAAQSHTEPSAEYGAGGKKITSETKSADGTVETETKYYDAKGKLREHRTSKKTQAGKSVEIEYYDEKERKTKRTKDTYDICGIRTSEQTEHYNDGVLQDGEIIEWGFDESKPASVKEWDPGKQRYDDRPVDEWMKEKYPFEKGLELKFGARPTNGCPYALAQSGDGLSTLALNTELGKISVHVTDDLAGGDTFSGTVVADPAGSSPAERERNREKLNRYSLYLGSKEIQVAQGIFVGVVSTRDEAFRVIASDGDGRGRGHFSLRLKVPMSIAANFRLPRLGQTGRPVRIIGHCDGDLRTTHVKIGGAEVPVLAESPRQVVVRNPIGVPGLTEIAIEEGGRTRHAPFRIVAVNLAAPKTNLLRGEQTSLTVRVSGLQGIQEELPLILENKSPAVVSMTGGDEQTISIHANQVNGGAYITERALTGITPGGFTILATLLIGDGIDELPGTATEQKAVIDLWLKYWQVMKESEAAKQAAIEAAEKAKAADEAAVKANEQAKNLQGTSKYVQAEMDANKATGEAEQKKTEADKLKKNSDDKAKAANDAKAALDKAEQKISDKTVLKGIYEDKAKTMAAEADQAQKTADAFKQSLKDKPTDAEKQEANDLQKKADIKKAEADALKKYGEAVNTSNKPN